MAKVIFAGSAEHDLLDIEYYIFTNLKNPQAVRRSSDGILDTTGKFLNLEKKTGMGSYYEMVLCSGFNVRWFGYGRKKKNGI